MITIFPLVLTKKTHTKERSTCLGIGNVNQFTLGSIRALEHLISPEINRMIGSKRILL